MKVTVERAALLKSLGRVHRIVERKNTIPVLSNLLMRVDDGKVRLKATDMDIEVTEAIPAEVSRAGATTVPAHMLHDIVRKMPEGSQVSLEMSGDSQMQVKAGRSRFTLSCLPEGDFPDLAAGEMPFRFSLDRDTLKSLLGRAAFAMSTEETRYYLNGIFLQAKEIDGQDLMLTVATDGHRLARIQAPAPNGSLGMPSIIIPRKAVTEILKLTDDAEAEIGFELSTAKVRISFGDVVLTSKLVDGTYPDYERVIPRGNDCVATLGKDEFAKAVDRVSTVSSERGRAVRMDLSEGKLQLSVTNPDSGSAVEEVEIGYEARPMDVGFNARYLLDITGQLGGDSAEMLLSNGANPAIFRDPQDATALYVLMPMRV